MHRTIIVISECRCHAWVCCGGGGVCRLAGWVCLGETRVSVAGFNVLCAVVFRLGASYFLPVGSLVVLLGISECAHGQWAKPIHSLFIVNISLYFITYDHRYYHICQSFCINLI